MASRLKPPNHPTNFTPIERLPSQNRSLNTKMEWTQHEQRSPTMNTMFTDSRLLRQPTPAPLYGVATAFALVGLTACSVLSVMFWYTCTFSGWGDGSTGNAIPKPNLTATLMVLPFLIYFSAGVTAALTTRRWLRVFAALAAHLTLLLLLGLAAAHPTNEMLFGLRGIYAIIAILFSLCWISVLRRYPRQTHSDSVDGKRIYEDALRSVLSGDGQEEIMHALEVNGFTGAEADKIYLQAVSERFTYIRRVYWKRIVVGLAFVAAGVALYAVIWFLPGWATAYGRYAIVLSAAAAAFGAWRLLNGLSGVLTASSRTGPVYDID